MLTSLALFITYFLYTQCALCGVMWSMNSSHWSLIEVTVEKCHLDLENLN